MEKEKIKIKAYLAHPTLSRKKIREWELKIEQDYNLDLINPFYTGGIEGEFIKQMDEGKAYDDIEKPGFFEHYLINRDVTSILQSDFVIGIIDGAVSYGTIQEIVYATLFKKPVYLIITNGEHTHPWLMYHSTQIFTSFGDFERFLDMHKLVNYSEMKWANL